MHTLNLGILAHVDAGKTSLTERLLFEAGAISELGSVDAGTTRTDSMDIERRRGITVRTNVASFAVGDVQVKGERRYDWALVASVRPEVSLLIRRSVSWPSDLAFYLCYTPRPAPLGRLVQVAGARWAAEECFQAAKNETGMDHYQVRRYESWYRYVTLAMLALAFLAVMRAALAGDDAGLANSANEIRRMLTALCAPPRDEQHARRWSRWRHHHQERARRCHYQRQRLQDH